MQEMEGEVGLVAGRSQREKRRSYKDLLREEEEIDAQVRKTSKKRRDSDPFATGNELHKKKKRIQEEENFSKERIHGQSLHHKKKKKKMVSEGRPSLAHSSSSNFTAAPHTTTETAMDLLQAITSPLATGSAPSPPHHHQQQSYKKLSNPTHPHHHHTTQRKQQQQQQRDDWNVPPHTARPRPQKKKLPLVREPLPVVGTEVELEGHYDGPMGIMGDSSSSAEELEAGELIIDDSYAQLAKKAKKSKKSKKKKEKEREKKHSLKGVKKVSKGGSSHSSGMVNGGAAYGAFGMAAADSINHRQSDKEKKKEKKVKDKSEKDKEKSKRKTITAYQIFCKEYRASINVEQPGLDFGELSKKLADAWNQLPEGDKEVWKERAQYLQHKQQMRASISSGKSASQSSSAAAKADKPKAVKRVESRPDLLQANGMPAEADPAASPVRVPEVDPIDAAAHLQLLGESLSVIGCRLQETEGMVTVSGSLSVLLDAMLCALGPLACLTTQVPELNGCPQHILSKTLDNIAYVMPGL